MSEIVRFVVWHPDRPMGYVCDTAAASWALAEIDWIAHADELRAAGWTCTTIRHPAEEGRG